MPNNPKLPQRRSVRLRGYDYAKEGMYFVTICVQNRACLFGEIRDKVMVCSPYGEIAHREWENIANRWPHLELGEFQIMPNHVHGIVVIHHPVSTVTVANIKVTVTDDAMGTDLGATLVVAQNDLVSPDGPETPFTKIQWATRPTLGQIIGAYTSTVATECLKWQAQNRPGVWLEKIWQRGFHEHLIRTVQAFDNISHYIINNPANWEEDRFFEEQ